MLQNKTCKDERFNDVTVIPTMQQSPDSNLLETKRDNPIPQCTSQSGDVSTSPHKHLADTLINVRSFDINPIMSHT